jgi:hypothetical protein
MELLAPNGKPSNLSKEQYLLVRTPEFKAWIGDWEKLALTKLYDSGIDEISLKRLQDSVSKVVDENGEPLVCRHYSQKSNRFTEFKKQKANDTRNFISYAKEGFYFSTTDKYSIEKIYNRSKKGLLYEVFLNVKNILDLGNYNAYDFKTKKPVDWKQFTFEMLQKYVTKGRQGSFYDYTEYNENVDAFWIEEIDEKTKHKIFKLGYNGVWGDKNKYADSIIDDFFGTDQIVVFEPNQIKLADGTNTTFDSNNPDIRFEDGGEITNYTEFFDNLEIEDGSIYIGQKFGDVFPFLRRRGARPNTYRNMVNQYYGILDRLRKDNFSSPIQKKRDLNKLERKRYIEKKKYLAKFYLDGIGTIVDFRASNYDDKNDDIDFEKGGELKKDIECYNCGWEWNKKDSEKFDMYVCHSCGFDNSSLYNSNYQKWRDKRLKSIFKIYMNR